jgi:uncharacterized membrane protein
MDSAFDTIFGLPTHVLVVHFVVVLLPLAAIGAVIMAIKQRWSVRFGPFVVAIAFVGLGVTVVAKESGQAFAERVGTPQPHAELADTLPYFALALFVTVAALWLLDRNGSAKRKRPIGVAILAIVVIAVAALTTLWTIRVGHSGSEAVWQEIVQQTQ